MARVNRYNFWGTPELHPEGYWVHHSDFAAAEACAERWERAARRLNPIAAEAVYDDERCRKIAEDAGRYLSTSIAPGDQQVAARIEAALPEPAPGNTCPTCGSNDPTKWNGTIEGLGFVGFEWNRSENHCPDPFHEPAPTEGKRTHG